MKHPALTSSSTTPYRRRHNLQKLQVVAHRKPARIRRHVLRRFPQRPKAVRTIHISAFDLPAFKEQGITEQNIKDVEYPDFDDDPDEFDEDYEHNHYAMDCHRLNGRLISSTDKGPNLPFIKPAF